MRKHVFRVLIASLLIGSCLNVTAFAEGATVTGSEVNVRSGPGVNFDVLGSVSRGTIVEVTDRSNGDWYAINYGGRTGYMSSGYLAMEDVSYPASVVADNSALVSSAGANVTGAGSGGTNGFISGSYVRFRKGPSSDTEILGEYSQGKALCIIDGQSGFVFSQYVSSDTGSDTATVIQTPEPAATPVPNGNGILIQDSASTQTNNASSSASTGTGNTGGVIVQFQPPNPAAVTPVPTTAPAVQTTPVPQTQANSNVGAGTGGNVTSYATAQTGTIIADHVRFRKGPGSNYSILSSYNKGKNISVLGTAGEWIYCSIDGQNGYVFGEYVQVGAGEAAQPVANAGTQNSVVQQPVQIDTAGTVVQSGSAVTGGSVSSGSTQGYIKGNNVRFRSAPDASSEILSELFYGNAVTIVGTAGDWTAIVYDGQSGFVFSQYVTTGVYQNVSVGGTASGREIADYALQFVGTPYQWGGKDPSTGFDCSGFMYYVYRHFGYTLNRVASEQALNGRHVETSDLQPGDLLCFYSGGSYIGHVGMYIGNNMFVHAATSTTGVITSELAGYYARRGFEARRII